MHLFVLNSRLRFYGKAAAGLPLDCDAARFAWQVCGLPCCISSACGHTLRDVAMRMCVGKDKEPIRSVPTSVKEAPAIGGKSSADAEQEAPLRVSLNKPTVPSGGPDNSMQVAWRRLLKEFSSLPRAIAIMFAIAGLSGLGTIIPQNKARVAAASV